MGVGSHPPAGGALHAMLNNGRIYLDQKQKVIDIQGR